MNRIRILSIIVSVSILASCHVEQLTSPNFDVMVANVEKVQEPNEDGTELLDAYLVTFRFSGEPDNIVFYSGEEGSEYLHRNRTYRDGVSDGITKMQFTTTFSGGSIPNTLRILLSNDFEPPYVWMASIVNGNLTNALINAATWTDITERFNLPGNTLVAGAHSTGEVIIAEFHQDMPFFIGFWFDADKSNDETLDLGQWVFSNFQIRNEYNDGTSEFYVDNVLNYDWRKLELADSTGYTVASNRMTLNGNVVKTIVTEVEKEVVIDEETGETEWVTEEEIEYIPTLRAQVRVVSRPFYPLHVDADKGVALKSQGEYLYEYTHLYVNPPQNSIRATFVATNSLYSKDIREVKEIEVAFEER